MVLAARGDRRPLRPTVLFVCVHNAGRSQMAAGFLRALAGDRVEVLSAGSEPGESLNAVAVQLLRNDQVQAADVVITMGCGDTCPVYPGKRYQDWELEDPAGKDLATVRRIRDQVRARVESLVALLAP
ncbi:MAG: arsenate reductase ArsC [Chloroflexi bacterium]|nr:MAG: arsenate reductase ArsC [Chloroflexota bacterium]